MPVPGEGPDGGVVEASGEVEDRNGRDGERRALMLIALKTLP